MTALPLVVALVLAVCAMYRNGREGYVEKNNKAKQPWPAPLSCEPCKIPELREDRPCANKAGDKCCRRVTKDGTGYYKLVKCRSAPPPPPPPPGAPDNPKPLEPKPNTGEGGEDNPKLDEAWEGELQDRSNVLGTIFLSNTYYFARGSSRTLSVDDYKIKMTVRAIIVPEGAVVKLVSDGRVVQTLRGGKVRLGGDGMRITGIQAFWEK